MLCCADSLKYLALKLGLLMNWLSWICSPFRKRMTLWQFIASNCKFFSPFRAMWWAWNVKNSQRWYLGQIRGSSRKVPSTLYARLCCETSRNRFETGGSTWSQPKSTGELFFFPWESFGNLNMNAIKPTYTSGDSFVKTQTRRRTRIPAPKVDDKREAPITHKKFQSILTIADEISSVAVCETLSCAFVVAQSTFVDLARLRMGRSAFFFSSSRDPLFAELFSPLPRSYTSNTP